MPFTTTTGARIFWRQDGDDNAPPMVLLHGIGLGTHLYDSLVPHLREDFRLIRVDLRGHGPSDAPAGDYTMADLAADVVAVMDDAGVSSVLLCGLSLGGMVAQEVAISYPARVHALALACTAPVMEGSFWPDRIRFVHDKGMEVLADTTLARQLSPTFLSRASAEVGAMRHGLKTMPAAGYIGCAAAIRDMDHVARLPAIVVPTTVITGAQDLATPLDPHGMRLLAGIAGSRHVGLDTGHLACMEDPAGFAAALHDLAAQVTA